MSMKRTVYFVAAACALLIGAGVAIGGGNNLPLRAAGLVGVFGSLFLVRQAQKLHLLAAERSANEYERKSKSLIRTIAVLMFLAVAVLAYCFATGIWHSGVGSHIIMVAAGFVLALVFGVVAYSAQKNR